jgi:hypothetical protein
MRLVLGWPRARAARSASDDAELAIRICEVCRLDDVAGDAYDRWRRCSAVLDAAYARWTLAAAGERAAAFADYSVALTGEQRAARRYATSFARCVRARERLNAVRGEGGGR